MEKWEQSTYDMFKHSNIHIICIPKRKYRENGAGKLFKEVMTKNIFSNVMKYIKYKLKEFIKAQAGYKQIKLYLHTS